MKDDLPWESWVRFCRIHSDEMCAMVGTDVQEELENLGLEDYIEDEDGNLIKPVCTDCFIARMVPEAEAQRLWKIDIAKHINGLVMRATLRENANLKRQLEMLLKSNNEAYEFLDSNNCTDINVLSDKEMLSIMNKMEKAFHKAQAIAAELEGGGDG